MRSAVQTEADGEPVPDPRATQVVVVQERPVIEEAPLGSVDSVVHVLGPAETMDPKRMAGPEEVEASPSQTVVEGQVIVLKAVTVGMESVVKVGVHRALVAKVAGSPSKRRTMGAAAAKPTVAVPASSQVEVVGQASELIDEKTVAGGATAVQTSCCGDV